MYSADEKAKAIKTLVKNGGKATPALSKIMGHRDASMTLNVYVDAPEEAKRQGMDAFDETLKLDRKQECPCGRHMRR